MSIHNFCGQHLCYAPNSFGMIVGTLIFGDRYRSLQYFVSFHYVGMQKLDGSGFAKPEASLMTLCGESAVSQDWFSSLFDSHKPLKTKTPIKCLENQETPTNSNADHVKETDVKASRIKCNQMWSVDFGV